MIIQEIIQIGNPLLHKKAKVVKDITSKETKKIIKNLIDSMRASNLIGIAAPQIGLSTRIFVTEIRSTKFRESKESDQLKIFINPKIIQQSKAEIVLYEGCGSVAYTKIFGPVKRPKEITIEAYNEKGEKFILKAKKLLARVIQHEFDHLEGITFIEKISDNKKLMSSNEYTKKFTKKK